MKNLLKIAIVGFASVLTFSCSNNPQPVYYGNQPPQQQQVQYQDDYQNQQPILVHDGSSSFLMDYLLYQSLMNSHQNPAYYYHTHRYDTHIHVYNGRSYSGYSGRYSTVYRPVVVRSSPNYNKVSRNTNYYNRARTTVTPVVKNYSRPTTTSNYTRSTPSYKPSTGGYNRPSSSISRSFSRPSSSNRSYSRH